MSSISNPPVLDSANISFECFMSKATTIPKKKTKDANRVLKPIIISKGAINSVIKTPYAMSSGNSISFVFTARPNATHTKHNNRVFLFEILRKY